MPMRDIILMDHSPTIVCNVPQGSLSSCRTDTTVETHRLYEHRVLLAAPEARTPTADRRSETDYLRGHNISVCFPNGAVSRINIFVTGVTCQTLGNDLRVCWPGPFKQTGGSCVYTSTYMYTTH